MFNIRQNLRKLFVSAMKRIGFIDIELMMKKPMPGPEVLIEADIERRIMAMFCEAIVNNKSAGVVSPRVSFGRIHTEEESLCYTQRGGTSAGNGTS
jgi:hypothetical protein